MDPNPLAGDTIAEALRVQFAVWEKMGLEGRARMGFTLSENLRRLIETGVRQRHPDYTEQQVHLAAIRLVLGEALFAQAYGPLEIAP